VGHYFDVITHGYGAMYPYASRVEPRDRWAIIAYIRLLQSRSAKYGMDAPQTEGGPGIPVFKGGKIYQKPREGTEENAEHEEAPATADVPDPETVKDSEKPQAGKPEGGTH
jgi:hypothetical protein